MSSGTYSRINILSTIFNLKIYIQRLLLDLLKMPSPISSSLFHSSLSGDINTDKKNVEEGFSSSSHDNFRIAPRASIDPSLSFPVGNKRPLWLIQPTAGAKIRTMYFEGKEYILSPLSSNGFVSSMTPVISLKKEKISEKLDLHHSADSKADEEEAALKLEEILSDALENHNDVLEKIRTDSQNSFIKFVEEGDHPLRHHFDEGIDNYVSVSSKHVLFNARLLGYKKVIDFLKSMDYEKYQIKQNIENYFEDLTDTYGANEDMESLQELYEKKFPDQTNAFTAFFDLEKPFLPDNAMLVHGVITQKDEEISVGVNAQEYYKAFIQGKPIVYHIPLSTTASVGVAIDYSANKHLINLEKPVETLDLTAITETTEKQAKLMLDTFEAMGSELGEQSLLHFFYCKNAQGIWLTHNEKEKEILLRPDHVVLPKRVIRGEGYSIFVAEINFEK